MKCSHIAFALCFLASEGALAQFCAIDMAGNNIGCYPTLDSCRNVARNVRGGCVISGNQASQQQRAPTLGEILYQAGQEREQDNQQMAEQMRRDRAATHPKLLPLVASDGAISRETQEIIFSTLHRALELDVGNSQREWKNHEKGSYGVVNVKPPSANQYGDICRNFQISLADASSPTRWVDGVACRSGGKWKLL